MMATDSDSNLKLPPGRGQVSNKPCAITAPSGFITRTWPHRRNDIAIEGKWLFQTVNGCAVPWRACALEPDVRGWIEMHRDWVEPEDYRLYKGSYYL